MISPNLPFDDTETGVLVRAIVAAKFGSDPIDPDLLGSSILSRLSLQLIEHLKARKPEMAQNWIDWQRQRIGSQEWQAMVAYAQSFKDVLDAMQNDDKITFIRTLFHPFLIADEDVSAFLQELAVRNDS
jgi:hypothetical protein